MKIVGGKQNSGFCSEAVIKGKLFIFSNGPKLSNIHVLVFICFISSLFMIFFVY